MMEPKSLFDSTEEEEVVSLTSTSDDEVFFGSQNPQKLNQRLKRNLEIRRLHDNTLAAKSSQIGSEMCSTTYLASSCSFQLLQINNYDFQICHRHLIHALIKL